METKAPAAQKITKIEPLILRSPPERDKPESYFSSMPPVAQMTGGKALSYRLDHAETARQGGYRQTELIIRSLQPHTQRPVLRDRSSAAISQGPVLPARLPDLSHAC